MGSAANTVDSRDGVRRCVRQRYMFSPNEQRGPSTRVRQTLAPQRQCVGCSTPTAYAETFKVPKVSVKSNARVVARAQRVPRGRAPPLTHAARAGRGASADSDAANAPSGPPPSGLFLRTLQDQQLRSALTQYAKNDMTLTTHHSRRRPRGSRCSTPTTTVIPPLLRWFVVSITLSVMLRGAHRESKKESRSRSRSCQLLCC